MSAKFEILEKLGQGQFGIVYLGNMQNKKVAIKIEYKESPYKLLKHESKILFYLKERRVSHIPVIYYYGLHEGNLAAVMTLYECSFEEYIIKNEPNHVECTRFFHSIIEILENVHNNFVLHCDIKPSNFMMKHGELYLIDFGLSKIYINEENQHYPQKKDCDLVGTPKYMSLFIHGGSSPSRRDDLISSWYVYMFSLGRALPWDDCNKNSDYITEKKGDLEKMKHHILGNRLQTLYSMKFEERPNYQLLRIKEDLLS